MRGFQHLLSISLILLASGATMTAQIRTPLRYHALVIGINDYDYWGDLRRARKDAESVAEVLSAKYDFASVKTLFDTEANGANIEDTLRRISSELSETDALLIYFSGHGYYDELLDQGFWIPSDGRIRIERQPAVRDWIENDRIKQYLSKCAAKHVLIVSDACFSGSLFKGGYTDVNPTTMSWYQHVADQPSRWAITSGDMELVPDAGIFGMKLLQLLKFPPREVFSVSDLASWLRQEVASFDGTLPLAGPLDEPNHMMGGEFVFVDKGIESGFWSSETSVPDDRSSETSDRGQLLCYSNLPSQVYVDGNWVGFVEGGESLLIDSVLPGERNLLVKSDAGVFQKTLEVAPLSTSHVNAVFYLEKTVLSQSQPEFLNELSDALYLNMDAEQDMKRIGFLENNGALVARDAIRGNALRFQQRGNVVYRGSHLDDFGRGDFSVSLWFKWMGIQDEGEVLISKEDPSNNFGITVRDGFLVAGIISKDPEVGDFELLSTPYAITPETWHHVVFQRSGTSMELWYDGRLAETVEHDKIWNLSNNGPLVLGYSSILFNQYFTGLMDEVELRRSALSHSQVESAYHLKFEKYRITRKTYSEREDLDLIAKKLYGGNARLADWQEILSRFDGELDAFWDYLGLEEGECVWLTYLNRRFFNSARHFYMLKSSDVSQIDEEVHQSAELQDGNLVLSSWIQMELPMLIEL